MELETIMLSKISQAQKNSNTTFFHSHEESRCKIIMMIIMIGTVIHEHKRGTNVGASEQDEGIGEQV
jgi:hypothetical protein